MDYENIFKALEAPVLATHWEEKQLSAAIMIGEALFPHVKTPGLTLRYMMGESGFPVALKPSQFDTKATVRDHIGVNELQYEMPFFREGASLRERVRQDFLEAQSAENKARYEAMLTRIYDDRSNLIDGARVQVERMRSQLLQTGEINITENRVPYVYDFEFPAEHKIALAGDDTWDKPETSDPYEDILQVQEIMEGTSSITRAICSMKTFRELMKSESLRKAISVRYHDDIKLTKAAVRNFIFDDLGVSFLIPDAAQSQYRVEEIDPVTGKPVLVEKSYWQDGIVTFIPDGFLGQTHWGTTPEELDLTTGVSNAKVAVVDRGIAVTTYVEEHPVNLVTLVSAITMPSFEEMKKVCIAQVY